MDKWFDAIKQLGFPIVVALLLLFVYLTELRSMAASLKEHLDDMKQLVPLMRQTCVNTAKDETSQGRCLGQ